jgi:DMSO/TMAO reductase YedYZ heme-binding membrane subunit
VQVTSYLRRWLSTRVWHGIHMLSYLVVWTAALHAGLAGTDVANRAYQVLALVLTIAAAAAGLVRILAPGRRSEPAAAGSRPQDEVASGQPEMTFK